MRKTLATVVLSLIGAAAIVGCTSQATPNPLPTATPYATATPTAGSPTPVPTATPTQPWHATPIGDVRIHTAPPEAISESLNPKYNVQASSISGETLPYTQAQLIRDSSYLIFYPQSITVDTSCLEKQVAAYSRGDIGIAPRIVDNNQLDGFAVWAKRAGAGNTRMNQDILQLGRSCQPGYLPPVEVPTPQLKL